MNNIDFLQIFGEIDNKILRQANDALDLWQGAQEGVGFRAEYSRKSTWRTVIASVVCTAAATLGVFVLLLNIGKIKMNRLPEHNNGSVDSTISSESTSGQGGNNGSTDKAAYLTMCCNVEGEPVKYTDECSFLISDDYNYFAQCTILENCRVTIEGINNFPDKRLEFSSTGIIAFRATTNEGRIGFKATLTATDPEKPASAVIIIGADTAKTSEIY